MKSPASKALAATHNGDKHPALSSTVAAFQFVVFRFRDSLLPVCDADDDQSV
jgi:hypothetical protein